MVDPILKGLIGFCSKQDAINHQRKVVRIHHKCIRHNKYEIADKIFQKYSDCFKIKSDAILADYWALLALKNR